ncbi:MFS transporter [Levilactobacillus fujinensis]|uniref:MFS transporter n=1 Tax=Levilactobacillus fujinensis TaxID=2486024 RepID=A0ABW1THT4_9LACO|nr:glycoside-pentoside-hexuronide (GPH):cation symporter [Levilactobacillus fujinensis]
METTTSDLGKKVDLRLSDKPFGLSDKLGYFFGDFGNDFSFMLMSNFLMVFYTDALGISPIITGTLFLVARLVDAVADVTIGRLVDNTKLTARGRYIPWISFVRPFIFASTILTFMPFAVHFPMGIRIAYIYITYIFWGITYSATNIPYGTMASAITQNPDHRNSLSTWRSVGGALSGTLVGFIVPLFMNDHAGHVSGNRMFMVAIAFAIVAFISYTITIHNSHERIQIQKTEKVPVGKLLIALLHNRALMSIICAALVLLVSNGMTGGLNAYLFNGYFHSTIGMSIATMMNTISTILIAPFAKYFSTKYGKKEFSQGALIFSAIIFGLLYLLQLENEWLFLLLLLFATLGSGAFNVMIWAFMTDVIDYQQFVDGSREDGTVYALYSFARKIGQAIMGGLSGFLLALLGYHAVVGGTTQSAATNLGVYHIATGIPALGYLLVALILIFWYPLNKKMVLTVTTKLRAAAEQK